jgi:hypothetical protein
LKNLVALVAAMAYFAATFLFYALADGIQRILSQTSLDPPQPPQVYRWISCSAGGAQNSEEIPGKYVIV